MKIHEATEQAYKNGYEDGKRDAVKHGRWEHFKEFGGNIGLACSACGWKDYHHGRFWGNWHKYCPNCGARMEGDGND